MSIPRARRQAAWEGVREGLARHIDLAMHGLSSEGTAFLRPVLHNVVARLGATS